MKVSYNKLWHLMLDRKVRKTDLKKKTGISSTTLANMSRDKNVSMEVLLKICEVLDCNFSDIMDALPDQQDTPTWKQPEKDRKYE